LGRVVTANKAKAEGNPVSRAASG